MLANALLIICMFTMESTALWEPSDRYTCHTFVPLWIDLLSEFRHSNNMTHFLDRVILDALLYHTCFVCTVNNNL